MEWLLPVSLVCITGGIILSVYEEWDRAGLTDTSLTSLACWVLGLCGVAGWARGRQIPKGRPRFATTSGNTAGNCQLCPRAWRMA